jgi:hypothetical protein
MTALLMEVAIVVVVMPVMRSLVGMEIIMWLFSFPRTPGMAPGRG